ncbi:DUF397 domain-containing protein [Streptomyces anandii]|uniref:DUF397 domain-containing protein n=1 Tax=Streptomyces anandii TaxID=285454 RepID=A0ABW6H2Z5_9ACTN
MNADASGAPAFSSHREVRPSVTRRSSVSGPEQAESTRVAATRLDQVELQQSQGDDCAEVAFTEEVVHVRDSKDAMCAPFAVARDGWSRFLHFVAEA